jgi:hypothetical protein
MEERLLRRAGEDMVMNTSANEHENWQKLRTFILWRGPQPFEWAVFAHDITG